MKKPEYNTDDTTVRGYLSNARMYELIAYLSIIVVLTAGLTIFNCERQTLACMGLIGSMGCLVFCAVRAASYRNRAWIRTLELRIDAMNAHSDTT